MVRKKSFHLACPLPIKDYPSVLLAHGSGGRLMHQIIDQVFRAAFQNTRLNQDHDSTICNVPRSRIAVTTDSFVVHPLFFPGGDIGSLSIYGTVNDLAMCGARPLYLTAGFILEEGFSMERLWQIVCSMQRAAKEAKVTIIAGDTKVVDKGKADGIFINTTGIGVIECSRKIYPKSVKKNDVVILSGDIGRHGMAIMAAREGLSLENKIKSDAACLSGLVQKLVKAKALMHCLRDLTRGGLATALVEIAQSVGLDIVVEEKTIPVREDVRAVCEILGLDVLHVANEGRFICFAPEVEARKILAIMHAHPLGKQACVIGQVQEKRKGRVWLRNPIGAVRTIDMLPFDQLPRIC